MKKKKILLILSIMFLTTSLFISSVGASSIWDVIDQYYIENPKEENYNIEIESNNINSINMNGEMVEGRFLVPMRNIFESLGAEIKWDGDTRTVTGIKGDISVSLTIDSKIAIVNKQNIELDVPATIVYGRTFVPLRFISESLGADVKWDEDNRVATVTQDLTEIKVFADGIFVPKPNETDNNIERFREFVGMTALVDKRPKQSYSSDNTWVYWNRKDVKHLEEVKIVGIEWKQLGTFEQYIVHVKKEDGTIIYLGSNDSATGIDLYNSIINEPGSISLAFEFDEPDHDSFTKEEWEAIQNNQVFVGMGQYALYWSWGSPLRKNQTVGTWGVSEQWVYPNSQYIYLEGSTDYNMKVTSFQSSR